MEQLDFFTIPSPCIGVCQANQRGYCKGCLRSREERFHWQDMNNDQKRHVIKLCRQRYQRLLRRKREQEAGIVQETDNPQQSLF
ncbi:DUF1289 domain-containing protein [Photobacterium galatheae]|uniref:Fe-S protein n=1 Tax=Photobacterium galatheae TaxID=1654360 RepID=A0A066RMH6_9GAMM|nr:DUF1289 domain-containing protein [Photobacterium galatheae]KDM91549.1 Fe-S protein [Photobacterium galatheae]MCM0149622.1 DUF1289 domain-containing protein [Photobacterium galatheae]